MMGGIGGPELLLLSPIVLSIIGLVCFFKRKNKYSMIFGGLGAVFALLVMIFMGGVGGLIFPVALLIGLFASLMGFKRYRKFGF